MESRKLSVSDLVERTAISKAGLYLLLDGTTKPEKVRFSTVHDICKALKINQDWLMHGVGEMEFGRGDMKSQAIRIDADTIADAQEALQAIANIYGIKQSDLVGWVNDPNRLAIAIDAVLSVKYANGADSDNIIDLVSRIAARMRSGESNAIEQLSNGKGNSKR